MTILETKKEYERTASGKSWKTKASKETISTFSLEQYENVVNSVPFFNSFGYGAYCRAHYGYTALGYIPVTIVTVNPGRTIRQVRTYKFEKRG